MVIDKSQVNPRCDTLRLHRDGVKCKSGHKEFHFFSEYVLPVCKKGFLC